MSNPALEYWKEEQRKIAMEVAKKLKLPLTSVTFKQSVPSAYVKKGGSGSRIKVGDSSQLTCKQMPTVLGKKNRVIVTMTFKRKLITSYKNSSDKKCLDHVLRRPYMVDGNKVSYNVNPSKLFASLKMKTQVTNLAG